MSAGNPKITLKSSLRGSESTVATVPFNLFNQSNSKRSLMGEATKGFRTLYFVLNYFCIYRHKAPKNIARDGKFHDARSYDDDHL